MPVLLLLAAANLCFAKIWISGEGWVNESGEALNASTAKGQLDVARALEAEEKWKDARAAYMYLMKSWPTSIYAGEGQFKVGLMNERLGDFWGSFKAYQNVITKHPGSQFFDLAVERLYSIGNLYLSGEPQRLWKIPLFPSMDKTVQIYEAVIKAAPYGEYAAPSYFQIGQARENQSKWKEAIASYNIVLDKYPNSDLADDAQYQIGYAWLKAAREPEYDQSAAKKSIKAFEDFLVRFPRSEKSDQAKKHIDVLKGRISEGAFNIAQFYETQNNLKAAYIYYNKVVEDAPESDLASRAKERIKELRPLVRDELNLPPPEKEGSDA